MTNDALITFLRGFASAALDFAATVEILGNEMIVRSAAPRKEPSLKKDGSDRTNPKTTGPATVILRNPTANHDEILKLCAAKGIRTTPNTIRGLSHYLTRALIVIRNLKLDGHEFASNWLAKAPPPRRPVVGIDMSITEIVLHNSSATLDQVRQECRAAGISAKDKTIDGTYRYAQLALTLVQTSARRR